ncbi:uncharacterized protein LOC113549921, partial [Rhopalosiphum maidis]|uniref:uncharacterized protein LOC113549921 n=1 Tax=Rhopalosiphum maidis TaxID=43146 RepID=UPI000EFE85DB
MDDVREEKNHIFNIRLAKCTGLYQMLDPGTTKCLGRNVYHIALAFILMYLCAVSIMSTVSCLYYWTDNMLISLEDFGKVETALFVIYKMWIVIHHSNDIWNCLSITRYGFTSFGFRERHILDRWRKRSMKCSNLFAITYLICVTIFVGTTQAFRNKTTPVKNRDGSVGYYRQNIMNFYIIVSDETYNSHYNKFCFAEALFTVSIGMLFLIFDTLLATLCFAICGQMQIINATFESVGHKSIRDSHSPVDYIVDGKIKMSKVHDLIYDELKTIL